MGVAALVLGIIGTILGFLFPYGGIVLGVLALILGILGRKAAAANNQPTGTSTAGMVLGIVGLIISVTILVLCYLAVKKLEKGMEGFGKELEKSMKDAAKDPKVNKEFDDAFKKAMEDAAKNAPK